jgi:hypothetical protein
MGKSTLQSMELTVAGASHNCRFNKSHRIPKGAKRLTIKEDRSRLHYCLVCARKFLVHDLERMKTLLAEVDSALEASVDS